MLLLPASDLWNPVPNETDPGSVASPLLAPFRRVLAETEFVDGVWHDDDPVGQAFPAEDAQGDHERPVRMVLTGDQQHGGPGFLPEAHGRLVGLAVGVDALRARIGDDPAGRDSMPHHLGLEVFGVHLAVQLARHQAVGPDDEDGDVRVLPSAADGGGGEPTPVARVDDDDVGL